MNIPRKVFIGFIVIAAVAAGFVVVPGGDIDQLARRRSCGYHCNPDGSPATPAAPPTRQDADNDGIIDGSIQTVGRVNVHSGGRLHGSANKRVGCGGCSGNPASVTISGMWDVQLMGRTNVWSGGRAGGKAQPRLGQPAQSNYPRFPKSKGWVSYDPNDAIVVQPVSHSSRDGRYTKRHGFGCGIRSC